MARSSRPRLVVKTTRPGTCSAISAARANRSSGARRAASVAASSRGSRGEGAVLVMALRNRSWSAVAAGRPFYPKVAAPPAVTRFRPYGRHVSRGASRSPRWGGGVIAILASHGFIRTGELQLRRRQKRAVRAIASGSAEMLDWLGRPRHARERTVCYPADIEYSTTRSQDAALL